MPIYDYVCSQCDQRTEVVHGIHGHGPKHCPACGAEGTMSKVFVPPAIHFKGSGWAKKDRSATSTPGRSRRSGSDETAVPATPATDPAGGGGAGGAGPTSEAPAGSSTSTATGKD